MTDPIGPLDSTQASASKRALATAHQGAVAAVADGWMAGGSFFGSIMAGTLLGWLVDRWLDTDPWLLITGIIAGAFTGFHRMWKTATTPTGKQPVDVA